MQNEIGSVQVFMQIPDANQLRQFLETVDNDFPIPLSKRVNFDAWLNKLVNNAAMTCVIRGDKIVSAALGYVNDKSDNLSFITVVATIAEARRNGLGETCVKAFCELASNCGFHGVHLYAAKDNSAACNMYEQIGFHREPFVNDEEHLNSFHYFLPLNRCALVTALGSFSCEVTIDVLRKQGFRVIGCDIYPKEWVVNSQNVDAYYQVPYAKDGNEYLSAIRDIAIREHVSYILPSTDYEIDTLIGNRDKFGETTLCLSPDDTLRICRDKVKTYNILEANGFTDWLIPTEPLSNADSADLTFPQVIKPINGRSSSGQVRVNNAQEFSDALSNMKTNGYIAQPILEGNICTVDVVRSKSGTCVAIPREEFLRTLNGAGTSVKVFRDAALEETCVKIAECLGVLGCVNFEFIKTDSGYRFLECNPRFSGGIAFTCMSGYDCVTNHIRCFDGLDISKEHVIREGYIARRYQAHLM